jgi:hypothetical protein
VVLSGNQALDPAGIAPAIVTGNRRKVTVALKKTCAPLWIPGQILILQRAASTYILHFCRARSTRSLYQSGLRMQSKAKRLTGKHPASKMFWSATSSGI